MSESFIRNLRLGSIVIFLAGVFMTNVFALFLGQIGLIISLGIPYFRLERLYFAAMNKPELKEKIEALIKDDIKQRIGVKTNVEEERKDEDTKKE